MEIDLDIMIEAYLLFTKFNISIPQEDYDQVDSLKLNFENMLTHSKNVSTEIAEMENPLLTELTAGISTFQNEINTFNFEFDSKGPMVENLPAKEASDRVNTFYDL